MVDLELGPAIGAGLVGGGVMIVLLYMGIAMMPRQMRMNLLLMLGGMVGHTGAAAYVAGLMMHAGMAIGFGVIHAALFAGGDIEDSILLWGLLFGAAHAVMAGAALAMVPAMHPLMRDGRMERPGAFALKLGAPTAIGFVMLHLIYGAVVAVLYDAFL
ncbi:MAG: hypothetical protein V3S31_04345 [Dehalococcoidia bacterium]